MDMKTHLRFVAYYGQCDYKLIVLNAPIGSEETQPICLLLVFDFRESLDLQLVFPLPMTIAFHFDLKLFHVIVDGGVNAILLKQSLQKAGGFLREQRSSNLVKTVSSPKLRRYLFCLRRTSLN